MYQLLLIIQLLFSSQLVVQWMFTTDISKSFLLSHPQNLPIFWLSISFQFQNRSELLLRIISHNQISKKKRTMAIAAARMIQFFVVRTDFFPPSSSFFSVFSCLSVCMFFVFLSLFLFRFRSAKSRHQGRPPGNLSPPAVIFGKIKITAEIK